MRSPISLIIHLLVLAVSVAIATTGLLAFDTMSSRGEETSALWTGTKTSDFWQVWDIAPGTSYTSLKVTIAAGAIGIVASLLAMSHLLEDTTNKRLYRGSFASCASFLATVIAFPWAFAATYSSSKVFRGPFEGIGTAGDSGHYSVESWACQTVSLRVLGQRGQDERICALAESSRWLTFLLFFVNIAMVVLFVRQERIRRERARYNKYETVSKVEPSQPA